MWKTRIYPCLWFDGQAEAAAAFYVGIFPNSKLLGTARYGEAGREVHGHAPGTVLTVEFELDGLRFTALNGGPQFQFNEAVSLQIDCDTQAEIDHYWDALGAGGAPQSCGWLRDRYGVTWQVVPSAMVQWLCGGDAAAAERVMAALMPMKKLDLAALQRAYDGR
ncbi:VOC family protein [Solimonas marina]|uniref:VOC family protein n=1 Tax=Solimonas marina TaxID=2714601 RepID=A0A969W6M5_9GAMM|nr:VOC family protein [Solimonas marina]NKF20908.1 VOC family protein [Solimonas marina]